MVENHVDRRALMLGAAAVVTLGATAANAADTQAARTQESSQAGPDFKPINRLPAGWNLVQTRAFLAAEGFVLDQEPKGGNGWLQASKLHHYVRIEFKAGYSGSVLEMAEDS